MQHVRTHDNILKLKGFFEKKGILQSIIDKPSLWTGDEISNKDACLDEQVWDEWALKVINAVQMLKPHLKDLDDAIVAFLQGAFYLMRIARKRDESGHQKALKAEQIRPDEAKIAEIRKKELQMGGKT